MGSRDNVSGPGLYPSNVPVACWPLGADRHCHKRPRRPPSPCPSTGCGAGAAMVVEWAPCRSHAGQGQGSGPSHSTEIVVLGLASLVGLVVNSSDLGADEMTTRWSTEAVRWAELPGRHHAVAGLHAVLWQRRADAPPVATALRPAATWAAWCWRPWACSPSCCRRWGGQLVGSSAIRQLATVAF